MSHIKINTWYRLLDSNQFSYVYRYNPSNKVIRYGYLCPIDGWREDGINIDVIKASSELTGAANILTYLYL